MSAHLPNQAGYKQPPKATQFKPGMSGNPNGRPKGRVSLASVLQKALSERVVIRENGRARTLSKLDVVVKQVVNKAASGDMRAAQFLVSLMALYAPEPSENPAQDPLENHDQQLLASIADRMRRAAQNEVQEFLDTEASHES